MPTFRRTSTIVLAMPRAVFQSVAAFVADVFRGMLVISHNALAVIGLLLVSAALFAAGRDDLRQKAELEFLSWLQARQEARIEPAQAAFWGEVSPAEAIARATASDPKDLDQQQAAVAHWLARRYRVAPEPISRLVQEAWSVGQRAALDPTLILAIMAIESSFNPFAQSTVGAQGLMQVMTKVHDDKYEPFGGTHAAFDPITNLRVGVAGFLHLQAAEQVEFSVELRLEAGFEVGEELRGGGGFLRHLGFDLVVGPSRVTELARDLAA